ncbi:MAG: hypothetical protein SF052_23465 [Bacteroidia bacterium]|nr:hypothetical protein [Bacteroidia bacterium]
MQKLIFFFTGIFFFLSGCEEYVPYPRPFGFPRIDFPTKTAYTSFSNEICPFTFEYPDYGKISRSLDDSCWVDIHFPVYDCKWHITYRTADKKGKDRHAHYEDYRRLIYKHSKKATQIQESPITVPAGQGILFEIYGNVGTPAQVFLYDSTETQIVMMSFYFQTALKNDSLQPVINYMKGEIGHTLETFQWK